MEYQSFGRYQKPKGSNIIQVLKLMIVLAICVWFLYQIKHTETKNYDSQTKLAVGSGAKFFGRKGIMSRSDEGAFPDSGMLDSVGEVTNEFNKRDDKEKGVQLRELQNDMHVRMNAKSKFSLKQKDEDIEETGIKEKGNEMHKNVVESAANADEETNEVQSFHDENGVPPDFTDENISTFSKVNWLKKINIYEVTYKKINIYKVTYGEDNDVEMNLDDGLMSAATAIEEINTGSTTHVYTSGLQSINKWR